MSVHVYTARNAAMATTAATASVTTGTVIKTMLQIAAPSTRKLEVLGWGYSLDDSPDADAVVELLQTDVAATVTAHVAAGVQPVDAGMPASLVTLGTSATGYTATAEGTPAATRSFDLVSMAQISAESAPYLTYSRFFPIGQRPLVSVSTFLRIRATTPTTGLDMRCWISWAE